MFMFLQKNKKGFTLIELMVVVAIIGILALLGLRVYSGQQDRAKEAIVKGNAGTIQTLLQSELADRSVAEIVAGLPTGQPNVNGIIAASNIRNPFDNKPQLVSKNDEGNVEVVPDADNGIFEINGYGKGDKVVTELTARR